MEFTSTIPKLPTFYQWLKSEEALTLGSFPAQRIFCNEDWKTITIVTTDFRYGLKFDSSDAYNEAWKFFNRCSRKLVVCEVVVSSPKDHKLVLDYAGDACESPKRMVKDDWGWKLEKPKAETV